MIEDRQTVIQSKHGIHVHLISCLSYEHCYFIYNAPAAAQNTGFIYSVTQLREIGTNLYIL